LDYKSEIQNGLIIKDILINNNKNMDKRTKIVATISDINSSREFLTQLFAEGVNVVRINSAHQKIETTKQIIDSIREIDSSIAIMIDTKGPEIRTSSYGSFLDVETGDEIFIKGNSNGESGNNVLYVNYNNFVHDVSINNYVLIDDGDIALRVVDKDAEKLKCIVENSGKIKNKKGVNVPNVKMNLPVLSEKDVLFINLAIDNEIDFIAHSFVQHADDVKTVRKILNARNSEIKVIAKIENQEGVDNIDNIINEADGIMVARGDLGIEIPVEKIPIIQRKLVSACIKNHKMVIVATQMLHSMINNPRPTRAEVNDVATAVYEKADALMLSGETANGQYPLQSVAMMRKIIKEVENTLEKFPIKTPPLDNDILSVLTNSAVVACNTLDIKAIVVDTISGRTARHIASYRGRIPVYAFCYNEYTARHLALSYGVKAYNTDISKSRDHFLKDTIEFLVKKGAISLTDKVVVLGGSFGPTNGVSFMEISTAEKLMEFSKFE